MTGSVAAILLAAGKSRRMGSCKQLLPLGESTVIVRCIMALVTGGVGEIVVVVSEEGNDVAEAVRSYPVRIVANPECDGDMASSVRTGRDALTKEAGGVIVSLCDYPLVSANTITSLIVQHGESPGSIITPCHQGRRGHPLLVPRDLLDDMGKSQTLRDLLRSAPDRIRHLSVDDPGVLLDMDTPEEYRRISAVCTREEL
ncbi:MAG: nucleotidyltransferase family protein [Geobacteraceae bacterium]